MVVGWAVAIAAGIVLNRLFEATHVKNILREVFVLQKAQKGRWRPLAILTTLAVAVAGLMVLLSLLGGGDSRDVFADIPQDGTRLGREDAPVTIRLYEDFQCPACGQFARETLPEVVERHVKSGNAKLVSETMAFIGEDSVPAARTAFAAGEQDRYWQYAALFFENQGAENSGYVTDGFLTGLARQTDGLDVGRWQQAREKSYEEELRAVQQRAAEKGVSSTPSLVVTGPGGDTTLTDAVPIEDVDEAIEEVN